MKANQMGARCSLAHQMHHQISLLSCLKPSCYFSCLLECYTICSQTIKLYTIWPPPTSPTSFLTACFTRTQLLSFLPLPQVLSLAPAHSQAVHTEVLSYFHMPNCIAYFGAGNFFKDNIPITRPKILLPVILSLFSTTQLYFFITLRATGNVIMFNICLLVSTLPSPRRKADP